MSTPALSDKYVSYSKYGGSASYRMSALWIHLEMYPLFISPVCRSLGKMVEMCSQQHQSQQTGVGGRGGRENPVLENDAV